MPFAGLGGSTVPVAVTERATRLGIKVYRSYGSTEHPSITGLHARRPGGQAAADRRPPARGRGDPPRRRGRDLQPGPGPLRRLHRPRPRRRRRSTPTGWYRTGDVGVLDADGYLTITDRVSDIIIRGGENISAQEIEELLLGLDAVAEVGVVAAPDERLGEHAAAVDPPAGRERPAPTLEEVRAHLAGGRPGPPEVAGVDLRGGRLPAHARRARSRSSGSASSSATASSGPGTGPADAGNAVLLLLECTLSTPVPQPRGTHDRDHHREAQRRPSGRWSRASTASGSCSDDALPGVDASTPSRPTARSCSAASTSTTRPRWPSAASSGTVEKLGQGEHPEIFRVTLDPTKNAAAKYLRGTFDWHIDGCTDDIPIMATMLSAHAVAESGGETEFASSYDGLRRPRAPTSRSASSRCGSCTRSRPPSACTTPTPPPRRWRCGAGGRPRSTRWCGPTASGRKSLVLGATADHVVGMDARRGQGPAPRPPRPGHHARPRLPARVDAGRRRDLGQPRRAPPGLPRTTRPLPATCTARPSPATSRSSDRCRAGDGLGSPIVTGAASGIGLAIAERLAADGSAVAIFDRDAEAGAAAAAKISGRRGHGRGHGRRRGRAGPDRRRGGAGARAGSGAPTVLVNNAGVEGFDPFLKISLEKWNRLLAVNLTGTFQCCQAVVPRHDRGGWGRIVNISSSSAQGGQPLMTHYVASKAGVIGFTKALALELGPLGHHREHDPARASSTPRCCGPPRRRACSARASSTTPSSPRCAGPAGPRTSPPPPRSSCPRRPVYITGQVFGVNGGRNTGLTPRLPPLPPGRVARRRCATRSPPCTRRPPATRSPTVTPSRPKGLNVLGTFAHHPALTAGLQHLQRPHALRHHPVAPPARAAGAAGGHRAGAATTSGPSTWCWPPTPASPPTRSRAIAERPRRARAGRALDRALAGRRRRADATTPASPTPPGRRWPPSSTSSS